MKASSTGESVAAATAYGGTPPKKRLLNDIAADHWMIVRLEALAALYHIDSRSDHLGSFRQSEALAYSVALECAINLMRREVGSGNQVAIENAEGPRRSEAH